MQWYRSPGGAVLGHMGESDAAQVERIACACWAGRMVTITTLIASKQGEAQGVRLGGGGSRRVQGAPFYGWAWRRGGAVFVCLCGVGSLVCVGVLFLWVPFLDGNFAVRLAFCSDW